MNEGVVPKGVTPDSDCNSNHPNSASFLSVSSQDVDFVQDNSDYQWFLDYGYRDGGTNHHTSLLSLPESYEAGDLNYYDAFAKNMDANLAEADMESFRTEDIHALLTNLPPMCTDHLSQENHRQGECYASVSGSMMAKFDFDSSISPHTSSQGEDSTSMSICKSELLFSPVREVPVPGANYSVDSLDCDFQDMMLTCQANKDNYTIAFEGSMTLYSEESDFNGTEKSEDQSNSAHLPDDLKAQAKNIKKLSHPLPMTQSDSGSFTTWSKLKAGGDNQVRRHPSGNNNNSGDDATHLGLNDNATKSQSMPNLYKQKLIRSLMQNNIQNNRNASDSTSLKRKQVKVFDIQHHAHNNSGIGASMSDMATSVDASSSENISNAKQPNFSLVKLFMKQKSLSTEGMSTTADQLSSTENWPGVQSVDSNCSETKSADHNRHLDCSNENKIAESVTKIHGYIPEEPEDEMTKKDISRTECSKKSSNNNNSFCDTKRTESPMKRKNMKQPLGEVVNRSIQTSNFSEILNLKNVGKQATPKPQEPVKVVEPSFLNKLKKEGEVEKPVYVIYPNYVLPNLDFLNEKEEDVAKILLMPQRPPQISAQKKRPFSCNDLEVLRAKGFSHVKDWDSLNFLLPPECREILSDIPEVAEYIKRTSSVNQPPPRSSRTRRRPVSCDYSERAFVSNQTNVSSSSSTATQPSSGYRGSSTILNDSQNSPAPGNNLNPLFVYRYDSVTSSEASFMQNDRQKSITTAPPLTKKCVSVTHGETIPPRPPLPKNILSKDPKRFSLCETNLDHPVFEDNKYKRISLQEPYYLARNKRLSETEDEGVDAGTSSSSLDEHEPPIPPRSKSSRLFPNMSVDELTQFEEFLKCSGISSSDHEELSDENLTQLRSYVSRFLSLKMNQEGGEFFGGKKTVSFAEKVNVLPKNLEVRPTFLAPNNSPNVSAFSQQKNYQNSKDSSYTYSSPQTTPIHRQSYNMVQKWSLVNGVTNAVDLLVKHFSSASNQSELAALGDSNLNPACAKIALTHLCPALYAVLSDGLKPNLETSFGAITNSVWQVVEASAKQGPLTKALNELVMRINSEDAITEGLVKFNTFVFGLLNVRSLDAWASYLRTRESVLKKHYDHDSLLILSHTGGSNVRVLLDKLITALQPLAVYPFQLDLFFETKQLQMSLKRMEALSPTHKLSFKQWHNGGLSMQSNKSNSDSEEASAATTVRHKSDYQDDENLPDILNGSASSKAKNRADKERPRSCCDPGTGKPNFKLGEDVTSIAKKRWSGIALNSKLYQVYDRLAREDDEEYTDSLENTNNLRGQEGEDNNSDENIPPLQHESLEHPGNEEGKPLNGKRFKKLQQRWEMLSGKDQVFSPPTSPTHTPNTPSKSRIPRLITSPVKPVSGIPIAVCQAGRTGAGGQKKATTPPNPKPPTASKMGSVKSSPARRTPATNTRTSRVDQVENGHENMKHPRPSSLPYKPVAQSNKSTKVPPRRAASSSLNRRPLSIHSKTPKVVRTLSHRLPSESGHLSYNEGENLKVILRVDDKWLLCCRGTQKGLVPVSAVISADAGAF